LFIKVLFMSNDQATGVETLQEIRDIMTRSSRFISLSGWSGVWAGLSALAGAAAAQYRISNNIAESEAVVRNAYEGHIFQLVWLQPYFVIAFLVLASALTGGLYFTWKKSGSCLGKLLSNPAKQLLINIAIPMIAGGIFCISLLYHGHLLYIAPACLIFYGLALINGSKYTFADVRYLGLLELLLGFINLFVTGYSLLLWAIGFGVLHIVYGIVMWNKYDRKTV